MVNFHEHLWHQLRFLEASCLGYDGGHPQEAVRLAVVMRTLFQIKGKGRCLLEHLEKTDIAMLSSASRPPGTGCGPRLSRGALPLLLDSRDSKNASADYVPRGEWGAPHLEVPFLAWWKEPVMFVGQSDHVLTRERLVKVAADKDGGAHIDQKLTEDYIHARTGGGMSIEFAKRDGTSRRVFYENLHFATLRQIAYEVLNSPSLLALAKPEWVPCISVTRGGGLSLRSSHAR